mgnify:CR=1 FL=1
MNRPMPERWTRGSKENRSTTQYVIVQHRIENDKDGAPKIKEVLLAYPDTKANASKRLFKWRTILEMTNLHLRPATKQDYRKKSKPKRKK